MSSTSLFPRHDAAGRPFLEAPAAFEPSCGRKVLYDKRDTTGTILTVPEFAEQQFAEEFEGHQAAAGRPVVTTREAQQVWDNGFLPRRNVRGNPDTRLLIGETDGGRRVTLVSRSQGRGHWHTYTAWDTKPSDLA